MLGAGKLAEGKIDKTSCPRGTKGKRDVRGQEKVWAWGCGIRQGKKVTGEQRPEGTGPAHTWEGSLPCRGNGRCEGPQVGAAVLKKGRGHGGDQGMRVRGQQRGPESGSSRESGTPRGTSTWALCQRDGSRGAR